MEKLDIIKFAGIKIAQGHGVYDESKKEDVIILNRFDGPNMLVKWPDGVSPYEVKIEETEESRGPCWTDEEMRREIEENAR